MTSKYNSGRILDFHHVSNAAVIIEEYAGSHGMGCSPESHFGTSLRETGKIFMVSREFDWEALDKFKKPVIEERYEYEGWAVYPIKVKVTASERQQKAIVELVE
jgi:hypothetical protein